MIITIILPMALTIKSPYSGKPVKVRDSDIGRSLRDEEGKIFYVLPCSDSGGYYAAKTRIGSAQEEKAYAALKPADLDDNSANTKNVYDATGKSSPPRLLVIIVILIILAAIAYLCYSWALNDLHFFNPKEQARQNSAQVESNNTIHTKNNFSRSNTAITKPIIYMSKNFPPHTVISKTSLF